MSKSTDDGNLAGIFPAVVKSYDAATRTCRVEIPSVNSGGDVTSLAEIIYPIGDKSKTKNGKYETEIEILPEDTVWVSFIGGDSRFPVIVGWRNPRVENSLKWRRFHHANIEIEGDEVINIKVGGALITINKGEISIKAGSVKVNGNIALGGGSLTHDGTNISKTHKHGGVFPGGSMTSTPS